MTDVRQRIAALPRYHKAMDGVKSPDGAWCLVEDVLALISKLERILEIERRNYTRLHLCPDHRDKSGAYCIVCQAEKRTREESALLAVPPEPNESWVVTRLRMEWWTGHGCPLSALYGDDGEMQCNASTCRRDFKRESLYQLRQHVEHRRLQAALAASPAPPQQERYESRSPDGDGQRVDLSGKDTPDACLDNREAGSNPADSHTIAASRFAGQAPPPDVIEALAAYAHEAWSGWMRHLFSKGQTLNDGDFFCIPKLWWTRWLRQMDTPYADLREDEKDSDRKEARRMLAIVSASAVADGDANQSEIQETKDDEARVAPSSTIPSQGSTANNRNGR